MLDTQHTVPGNGSHWALMSDFAPIKRQHVHDQDTNKRSWGLGKHQQGMTSMCSDNLPCVTKGVPGPAKRTKKAKQHRKNKSCKRAKGILALLPCNTSSRRFPPTYPCFLVPVNAQEYRIRHNQVPVVPERARPKTQHQRNG